jgi:hypothetical protein
MFDFNEFNKKLINLNYETCKELFFDYFYIYSKTYTTKSGINIYLLDNDRHFDVILDKFGFTRIEYDILYLNTYNSIAPVSYTNIIHNCNHLWKPFEDVFKVINFIKST